MSIEKNKEIVVRFLKNFSTGKIDDAMAMMADTGTWWVGGKPGKFALAGTKSKAVFTEMLKSMLATMPEGLKLTPSPSGFTAEGNRVAVEVESYGKTDSGKVYNNLYHFLFEVKEGKIQAVKEYLDTMHTKEIFLD